MQRAQDKVAEMQARSGALDELLASGQLTDLTSTSDDIQAQLDKAGGSSNVDAQIAALKAQVAHRPANCRQETRSSHGHEDQHRKGQRLNARMFVTGLALVVLYVIIITVLLRVGVASVSSSSSPAP